MFFFNPINIYIFFEIHCCLLTISTLFITNLHKVIIIDVYWGFESEIFSFAVK